HPDDLPCTGTDVPAVRLNVYDADGDPVDGASFTIAPSVSNPDWTADFDGDYDAADWDVSWASLATAFLTFEFYEVGASDSTLLASYVYAPGAIAHGAGTGFLRPVAGGDAAAAYFEVWADTLAA